MKKYALISVSDKTGIVELAKSLHKYNYNILATGNTAKHLSSNGIEVIQISDFTATPEVFEGRVKTLHPKIFGGILFKRNSENDLKQAEENNILPIDVVVVNLYPFEQTFSRKDKNTELLIEMIDIGGPSLIRAAAKNYKFVSVLTSSEQYEEFANNLSSNTINEQYNKKLALEAFSITSRYDTVIVNALGQEFNIGTEYFRVNEKQEKILRYGENPHQKASIYGNFFSNFEPIHGKELSYNNILDLISAVELVEEIDDNSCVIVKHNNPAGAATGKNLLDAYIKALKCDPVSAFGGIVAFNNTVDEKLADKLNELFLEVISAPDFSEEALHILKKKKNRRLIIQRKKINRNKKVFRSIPDGILVQDADTLLLNSDELKTVTKRKPTDEEIKDLIFAWKIAKHTKSNAIIFAKDLATLAIGAGQMSRLDSVKIAKIKAEEFKINLHNSVAASDAFFPFPDALLEIINCGATAVIQPGGSVKDIDVINQADQKNISMLFTNIRHFKH